MASPTIDSGELVSYTTAQQRFLALENPSVVGDTNTPAFQDELTATIAFLQRAIAQRQLDGVLSENEPFFELNNTQLYAFCLEYYLGVLIPKKTFFQAKDASQDQSRPSDERNKGPSDHTRNVVYRIKFLREADVFHAKFLDRAESMGILTDKKRREQYERLEAKQFTLSRDEKVQRFKLQREMEKKLAEVQKRRQEQSDVKPGASNEEHDDFGLDDEMDELEREQLMTFIQLAVIKSMDEQTSINQEKDMLESMLKMNAASAKQDLFSEAHRPPPPPQGQGISVTRINPQLEMRRETVRSGVFQPGHRLPTMSLAEYADQQVADAMERQERENNAPQAPRRYEQLVEDGDEDNSELVDEATYKDRAWDDWKDANPRGIGNKKGSQF